MQGQSDGVGRGLTMRSSRRRCSDLTGYPTPTQENCDHWRKQKPCWICPPGTEAERARRLEASTYHLIMMSVCWRSLATGLADVLLRGFVVLPPRMWPQFSARCRRRARSAGAPKREQKSTKCARKPTDEQRSHDRRRDARHASETMAASERDCEPPCEKLSTGLSDRARPSTS